jgi:C-terminal peptidase prc
MRLRLPPPAAAGASVLRSLGAPLLRRLSSAEDGLGVAAAVAIPTPPPPQMRIKIASRLAELDIAALAKSTMKVWTLSLVKLWLSVSLCVYVTLALGKPSFAASSTSTIGGAAALPSTQQTAPGLLDETLALVQENYVGDIPHDWSTLKEMARDRALELSLRRKGRMSKPGSPEWEHDEVSALLSLLNDPYSKHLPATRFETKVMASGGSQFGLGLELKRGGLFSLPGLDSLSASHPVAGSQTMVGLAAAEVAVSGAVRRSRGRWMPILTGGLACAGYSKAALEQGLTSPVIVAQVVPGSAAEAVGVREGDRVIAIDSQAHKDLDLEAVNDAFMARERASSGVRSKLQRNQAVTLDIMRPSKGKQRIVINPQAQARSTVESSVRNGVGILRLTSISRETAAEMERALMHMMNPEEGESIKGIVLDLRGNGGGNLMGAAEVASVLGLPPGSVVMRLEGKNGQVTTVRTAESSTVKADDVPMVVLTDRDSASSAEVIAGCLRDHKRATIVGQRTFGKGLAQGLYRLHDGSGVAISILKIKTPLGHEISRLGIKPHSILESVSMDDVISDYLSAVDTQVTS